MGTFRLFEVIGIELEYMIVSRKDLSVMPIADKLLEALAGKPASDAQFGEIEFSNELAQHVIELKLPEPKASISSSLPHFSAAIEKADSILADFGAQLLGTAVHPLMNPKVDSALWPHEGREIYSAFNRIFDCRSHGWMNLQSMHINLPFRGDEEFRMLHSALRLVLPLIPGLAASSPIREGSFTGRLDGRLNTYATHSQRIKASLGEVIPDVYRSQAEYEEKVYKPIEAELIALEAYPVLQPRFVNARGAMARFDRGAIEIRLIDLQENPIQDLAIAEVLLALTKRLVNGQYASLEAQEKISTKLLRAILDRSIEHGENAVITEQEYLKLLGVSLSPIKIGDVWTHLFAECASEISPTSQSAIKTILTHGTLASRINQHLGPNPTESKIKECYHKLAECLKSGDLLPERRLLAG